MNICFECHAADDLHDHHVVPRSLGGKQTIKLCSKCHGLIHGLDFTNHSNLIKLGLSKTDKTLGRPIGKIEKKICLQKHSDIIELLERNISIRKIAKLTNKGNSTVQRVKKLMGCSSVG